MRMVPRSTRLRRLGYFIAFLFVFYWISYYFPLTSEMLEWKEHREMWEFSMMYTAYFLVVCAGLYGGKSWAWWASLLGFCIPAWFVLVSAIPFLYLGGSVLWLSLTYALIYTNPWIDRLSPDIVNDVDAIAKSLGLRWEEQSLWQLVQEAQAGKVGEAVKQYRSTHPVTWDEAELAIKRWIGNEAELKVHLLQQYVAKHKEDEHDKIG